MGTFTPGSRLQIGTRLRRSLNNDLASVFIARIEVEGRANEFRRVMGMYDPILDLIFQFRKVALYRPWLKLGETIVLPIFFFGSGTFFCK